MTWKRHFYPSDSTGSMPEEKAPPEEGSVSEALTPTPDPLAQLQADLASAKTDGEQWRDRFLRKAAEFDNYRKRTDKEKADLAILARSSILTEFLPVADACARALQSLQDSPRSQQGLEQYREGVELLYKQLLDTFARLGVVPIDALGQRFDPHLHEALAREEDPNHEENTVIQELRRGYLYKDRLLRPSQVKVSTLPTGKE